MSETYAEPVPRKPAADRQPSWSVRLPRLPARYQAAFWILLFVALVILAAANR